ncbi:unnamed protein product [Amoebophrya sp. A25]|nr:unnamed protein product [Amoebophrya sp. A25]|eukprot:GSA25T00025068001.1
MVSDTMLGPPASETPLYPESGTSGRAGPSERHMLSGCYELLHFGHLNALRQVKQSAPNVHVVAAIHPNAEILRVKGGVCILDETEKERLLLGCKFVDEVAHGVAYDTVEPEKYNCAYCWHGDDEVVVSGNDIFGYAKKQGRFKTLRRTEGISTTLMISRFLHQSSCSLEELQDGSPSRSGSAKAQRKKVQKKHRSLGEAILSQQDRASIQYINATTSRISRFFLPGRPRTMCKSVVYVQGCFDLFHVGYLDLLHLILETERDRKQLQSVQDVFLVVGVLFSYSATTAQRSASASNKNNQEDGSKKGKEDGALERTPSSASVVSSLPDPEQSSTSIHEDRFRCLQSLHERGISILSLRCVDDVVLDVLNPVDETLRRSLGIDTVYGIKHHPDFVYNATTEEEIDVWVDGKNVFSSETIVQRVLDSRKTLEERQAKKVEPTIQVAANAELVDNS